MSKARHLQGQYKKIAAYKTFLNTPEGKIVFLDLLREHNVFGSIFDPDHSEMCRKEGERNAILRIVKILKIPESQMLELAEEIERNVRSEQSDPTHGSDTTSRIQW